MARALNRSLVHWLRPLPPSASGLMDRRQNLLGRRTEPIYGSDTVTLAGKNEKNSEFVVYTEDINPNVTFTTERLGTGVNHMVPLLLARWMASDLAAATSVFRHVAGLWNGTGFLDGAAVQAGRFSTRDLTYFLWAERATAGVRGFETDPAMVAAVEAQLWALQACEEGTALAVSYSGQGEALCPPHDGWGVGEQLVSIEANAMALALTDPRMRTVWFPRKTDDTLTSHTDGDSFSVAIVEHSATPVLSASNAKGNGSSPCLVFNAAYIPAVPGSGMATSGVLVRMCCGSNQFCFDCGSTASGDKTCNGRHPTTPVWKPGANLGPNPWSGPIPFPNRPPERVSFAPCDLATGLCADVNTSFIMDPRAFGGGETDSIMIEDPRAFHYAETGYYYNFYWRGRGDLKGCVGDQKLCNVALSKTKTPLVAGDPSSPFPVHTCLPNRGSPGRELGAGDAPALGAQRMLPHDAERREELLHLGLWAGRLSLSARLANTEQRKRAVQRIPAWPRYLLHDRHRLRKLHAGSVLGCRRRAQPAHERLDVYEAARARSWRGAPGGRSATAAALQWRLHSFLCRHDARFLCVWELEWKVHRLLGHTGRR
eukprot:COSAG04_NODE_340_length_16315_cov_1278.534410_12_plen_598_part_00